MSYIFKRLKRRSQSVSPLGLMCVCRSALNIYEFVEKIYKLPYFILVACLPPIYIILKCVLFMCSFPGPFYGEFLRGALNCKIKQFVDFGLSKRPFSEISGCNVTLTTSSPPERELYIYRKKTFRVHGGLSSHYKIVLLLKNEDRSKTDI